MSLQFHASIRKVDNVRWVVNAPPCQIMIAYSFEEARKWLIDLLANRIPVYNPNGKHFANLEEAVNTWEFFK